MCPKRGGRGWLLSKGTPQGAARIAGLACSLPPSCRLLGASLRLAGRWGAVVSAGPLAQAPQGRHSGASPCLGFSPSFSLSPPHASISLSLFLSRSLSFSLALSLRTLVFATRILSDAQHMGCTQAPLLARPCHPSGLAHGRCVPTARGGCPVLHSCSCPSPGLAVVSGDSTRNTQWFSAQLWHQAG